MGVETTNEMGFGEMRRDTQSKTRNYFNERWRYWLLWAKAMGGVEGGSGIGMDEALCNIEMAAGRGMVQCLAVFADLGGGRFTKGIW